MSGHFDHLLIRNKSSKKGEIIMNVNKNQSGTPIVIGIDHGYGNIKTASACFRTSVTAYDTEPTLRDSKYLTFAITQNL